MFGDAQLLNPQMVAKSAKYLQNTSHLRATTFHKHFDTRCLSTRVDIEREWWKLKSRGFGIAVQKDITFCQ